MTQLNHIQVLPTHVANKIAAGEVVDRPASVLKELMENALDAGSDQIDVEIVSGGRKLVSVSDNGKGMNRDDSLLSVERQATSKIRDVDDIEKIATLGFRGEALAAIASVSRFKLITCSNDSETGTELRITGGKMLDVIDVGCPIGTCIEVRDLFFNVPARRKFLRTYQTEQAHLRSCFMQIALANPSAGMSLKIDGREAHRLAAGSTLEERIRDLFGADYIKNLVEVDCEECGVHVTGYASLPAMNRSDRNEQYIFINGRGASAPTISYAVSQGYHTLLPERRHPSLFLYIAMAPELVDVNVHPTKKEVRFRRPSDVRDALIHALHKALGRDGSDQKGDDSSFEMHAKSEARVAVPRKMVIDNLPQLPLIEYPGTFGFESRQPGGKKAADNSVGDEVTAADEVSAQPAGEQKNRSPWAFCRVVGQIGGLYVVLETDDGYVMMDPHAAHERVLYEKLMTDFSDGAVQSQNLLMPETVEMGPKDALRVRKNLEIFSGMGFGISEFGGDAFVVDAVPSCFSASSAAQMIQEIAQALEQSGRRGGSSKWREEAIAQAACKAAVKARDHLDLKEIEQLVIDLGNCDMPYTCPHGRPTMIYTSFKELHRKFSRE